MKAPTWPPPEGMPAPLFAVWIEDGGVSGVAAHMSVVPGPSAAGARIGEALGTVLDTLRARGQAAGATPVDVQFCYGLFSALLTGPSGAAAQRAILALAEIVEVVDETEEGSGHVH